MRRWPSGVCSSTQRNVSWQPGFQWPGTRIAERGLETVLAIDVSEMACGEPDACR